MGNTLKMIVILVLVLIVAFLVLGVYVVQPIGAIPEGITILYLRAGTGLPFLVSPDGLSLQRIGEVSLMSRMSAMGTINQTIEGRIILRLPYVRGLYRASTGGVEFAE